MLIEFENIESKKTVLETDICIIGAGTCGLFLADELKNNGKKILLLDSGDMISKKTTKDEDECIHSKMRYLGSTEGRSFGLAGTSTLWGGQMIPVTQSDISSRSSVNNFYWPLSYEELKKYILKVKLKLNLNLNIDVKVPEYIAKHFAIFNKVINDKYYIRFSEWIPFKNRNFSNAFLKGILKDKNIDIILNATVIDFKLRYDENESLIDKIIISNGKIQKEIKANKYIVCAGALESTRLLLDLDKKNDFIITKKNKNLGKYFSDHLSLSVAKIRVKDWSKYNKLVAPVFHNNIMHTPRLEISEKIQNKNNIASGFVHFTFTTDGNSGFDLIRKILKKNQNKNQDVKFSINILSKISKDLLAMSYWRFFHKRLWIPRNADVFLQVDIEQSPSVDNCLTLGNQIDNMGREKLIIDWGINDSDKMLLKFIAEDFIEQWNSSEMKHIAEMESLFSEEFDELDNLYDVYHPTGTIMFGDFPENSVLDKNLCAWNIKNLYVNSTAVFPSAGSANPGLTHLALTSRLANHLLET